MYNTVIIKIQNEYYNNVYVLVVFNLILRWLAPSFSKITIIRFQKLFPAPLYSTILCTAEILYLNNNN